MPELDFDYSLRPCPFCASTDVKCYGKGPVAWVACHTCNTTGNHFEIEEQAIAAWNRRAVVDARSLLDEEEVISFLLKACHMMRDGADSMTFGQFHTAMHAAIGADEDYCKNVIRHFRDNPAAFLAHRTPQVQSREILRTLLIIRPMARYNDTINK